MVRAGCDGFRGILSAKPAATDDDVIARAPVLFARENTVAYFSDVPLLVYAEREGNFLTYTVIFSNEDGGTSTRALMDRGGGPRTSSMCTAST